MEKAVGFCGFRCDICGAYKENIKSEKALVQLREKWKEFYDYDVDTESLPCGGCKNINSEAKQLHIDCEFRICAKLKGITNCDECHNFPCEDLHDHHKAYQDVIKAIEYEVPKKEWQLYIEPYITVQTETKNVKVVK